MKKALVIILCFVTAATALCSCSAAGVEKTVISTPDSAATKSEATPSQETKIEVPAEEAPPTEVVEPTDPTASEDVEHQTVEVFSNFDPYSTENNYDIGSDILDKHYNTDYGRIIENYEYYSVTAGDKKYCNILLPPGYNGDEEYPVMYVLHGWEGSHSDQIEPDSYLQLVYGNMLNQDLTVPMIIINVDVYTDKLEDKDNKTGAELRDIYDKVGDDIINDLMPQIEESFYVKTGRENTALAGVSHGGTEALMTYFHYPDQFGYVAAYASDPGVVPTDFYEEEYLNRAIFDKFPVPDSQPYYLYMAVGTDDEYGIDVTVAYRDELNKAGMNNQTDIVEGYEHNYYFWRLCFYNFLTKIFKN